ncbi:MAG: DsbA family protein [Rhodobacteraceae bacterium]|nr:DsbA family protein [Paracoccaceae bacterium]
MNTNRRNTLLAIIGLGAAYAGLRFLPDLGRDKLVFEMIDDPLGFRRLTAGESSSGFDPFLGLGGSDADHLADSEIRVRSDICGALYGDLHTDPGIVPVASFSDYFCPYCRVQTRRLAALEARPDSYLRVIWHELPELGEPSILAAKAALAAKRQGAYVAFHQRLMKTSFQATPRYLMALADSIGIDHAKLIADMQGDQVARELETSAALGRILAFVGTPAMVIGRTVIQGEVSDNTLLRIAAMEKEEGWASTCVVA